MAIMVFVLPGAEVGTPHLGFQGDPENKVAPGAVSAEAVNVKGNKETLAAAAGAFAWNCRDELFCLGRKILCTQDVCRIDLIPNLQNLSFEWINITLHASRSRTCSTFDQTQEMVWKNSIRFSHAWLFPILSIPGVHLHRLGSTEEVYHSFYIRIIYIHRSTTSMDVTIIYVYTHDNASD